MAVVYRPFAGGDAAAFRDLNVAWIVQLFVMEPQDHAVLNDPEAYIIARGGHIFVGEEGGRVVACCALVPREPGCFELSKMAVDESLRGRGIGRGLVEYAVAQGKSLGASRLYLETNTKLPNAILVYQAAGCRELPAERIVPSAYARSNVYMEMLL
jgi:N-acetylglutamate synthase-like GNAT family acetyltransferase